MEIAELLGCPVVETRSTGAINIPRTHPLHSGFDPKEVVQGSRRDFSSGGHRALASGVDYAVAGRQGRHAR